MPEEKDGKKKEGKKKTPFYLPHWFLYIAWTLCILTILGCGFLLVWYGMAFGNNKTLQWLSSISLSLVQDVLLIQPIKVRKNVVEKVFGCLFSFNMYLQIGVIAIFSPCT